MRLIVLSCLLVALLSVSDTRAEGCAWSDFSCWQEKAEQGDAEAQNYLGLMYDSGRGVPLDDKQAVVWYR